MAVERILVDTNVLLTATTPARPRHQDALDVLNRWPNEGKRLCTCGQIMREYLVVATREPEHNGLGLAPSQALKNVDTMLDRMRFLDEDSEVAEQLRELIRQVDCRGKRIHDANLVAIATRHRVDRLVTSNVEDFQPFRTLLTTLELGSKEAP